MHLYKTYIRDSCTKPGVIGVGQFNGSLSLKFTQDHPRCYGNENFGIWRKTKLLSRSTRFVCERSPTFSTLPEIFRVHISPVSQKTRVAMWMKIRRYCRKISAFWHKSAIERQKIIFKNFFSLYNYAEVIWIADRKHQKSFPGWIIMCKIPGEATLRRRAILNTCKILSVRCSSKKCDVDYGRVWKTQVRSSKAPLFRKFASGLGVVQ